MFTPLFISRFTPYNVCPSCLSSMYRRSNFSRCQIRFHNLTTAVDSNPLAKDDGIIVPFTNTAVDAEGRKKTRTRPARKIKVPPIPDPTLLSNQTSIESLKTAPNNDGKPKKSKPLQKSPEKDTIAVIKQTKISASSPTTESKDKDGPIDSKSVRTSRKKEKQISLPKPGKGRIRRISSRRIRGPRVRYLSAGVITEHDGHLETSKTTEPSLVRGEDSSNPVAESKAGLNRQSIAMLQQENLGPKEKKLLMKQLRRSVSLVPIKLPDSRSQGLGQNKSVERSKKTKASKLMKRLAKSNLQLTEKAGMIAYEIKTINAADLDLVPIEKPQPPVPNLAYGLERVLFNPGVYHLRDPRSRVYNFDPYLESIMPVAEFDFNALKEYITSSRDETLLSAAVAENKKYTGSTSSMTAALAHFHFLLSQWRPVNISNLSKGFPETLRTFTQLQRAPSAVFLRWKNGTYAIDADKEFDTANVLMMLGKSMEKLLTLPTQDFERYRKENSSQISKDERNEAESFHYTTMGDFLMRSQLDAYDPRVPGTGMFDLKTRAVVSIRMDARNYHDGLGYEIRNRHGEFESYEREYYDMIRAAFLKYSLQVRMGRMDGIFVAYHNTERIFGFQYISLMEMDLALHGKEDLTIGDSEFKLSLVLLNRVLDRATARFPEKSLRLFFETRDTKSPFMYIFAEPIAEDDIRQIQNSKKTEIEEYQRTVLGIEPEPKPEDIQIDKVVAERQDLHARVEEHMDKEESQSLTGVESPNEIIEDGAVGNYESHRRSFSTEASIYSGALTLQEHVSTVVQEVEHANMVNVALEQDIETQLPYCGASDAANNLQPQISSLLMAGNKENSATLSDPDSKENFRIEDSGVDMPALYSEIGETGENLDEAVTDLKEDTELEAEVSKSADTDHEGKRKNDIESKIGNKELLAMTLEIRNKVNGVYVERPEILGPNDEWTVEYSLAEVPQLEKSQSLYRKTRRRRALIFETDKKDAKKKFHQSYARKLADFSSQGRKWRQEQNHIDQEEPVKVLGGEIPETQ